MDIIIIPLLTVLSAAIGIYSWIIIASVVMSWLVSFNVINRTNNFVIMLMDFLFRASEPALSRIRRFLPNLGAVDISPVILILFLWFLQGILGRIILKIMVSGV